MVKVRMNHYEEITYSPVWRSYIICWLFCWLIFPIFIMIWDRFSVSLTLTKNSVVLRRGILSRQIIEIKFDKIQTVEVEQNFIAMLFRYGTLMLWTSATDGYEIICGRLGNPSKIAEQIGLA